MRNFREETVSERQRRVTLSGGNWEDVRIFLNERLEGTGIEVIQAKNEGLIKATRPLLWRKLILPLKSLTHDRVYNIWGDLDLVAVKEEVPIAVISCKTSLHGRLTETFLEFNLPYVNKNEGYSRNFRYW